MQIDILWLGRRYACGCLALSAAHPVSDAAFYGGFKLRWGLGGGPGGSKTLWRLEETVLSLSLSLLWVSGSMTGPFTLVTVTMLIRERDAGSLDSKVYTERIPHCFPSKTPRWIAKDTSHIFHDHERDTGALDRSAARFAVSNSGVLLSPF